MRQGVRAAMCASVGLLLLGTAGCVTTSDLEKLDQGLTQKLEQGLGQTTEAVHGAVRKEVGDVRAELAELHAAEQAKLDDLRAEVAGIRRAQTQRQDELARTLDVVRTMLETEVVGLRQVVETLKTDTKAALQQAEANQVMQHKLLMALRSDQATLKDVLAEHAAANTQELLKLQSMADKVAAQVQSLQAAVTSLNAGLQQLMPAVAAVQGQMQALNQTVLSTYRLEEAALRIRLKALEEGIKQLEPAGPPKDAASGPAKASGSR